MPSVGNTGGTSFFDFIYSFLKNLFSPSTFIGSRVVHIRTVDEHGWNPHTHTPDEILNWIQNINPSHCWRMLSGPNVNFSQTLPNGENIVEFHQKVLEATQKYPYNDGAISVRVPFNNQDIPSTMSDAQSIWENFCLKLNPPQKAVSIDLADYSTSDQVTQMSNQLFEIGYKYISFGAGANLNAPKGSANWASLIMANPANYAQYFSPSYHEIQELESIGGYIHPYLPQIDFPGAFNRFDKAYPTADDKASAFHAIAQAQTPIAKNIWKIIQLPEWDISTEILSNGTSLLDYVISLMQQFN